MNKIAVLIPCYNEEMTIGKVIQDFQNELPHATIYVYDNNSDDKTFEIATAFGVVVRKEHKQGKGNVVRSMFRDIDADIYILIDGDDTYPVEEIHKLIQPIKDGQADMVIGDRLSNGTYTSENKRSFHNLGNNLVRNLINGLFQGKVQDIMTGYRVFNRVFVKNIPIMSKGFQIETEMSVFSLVNRMNIVEIPITYRDRPAGSESKLNTVKDGIKVLLTLFNLYKNYRPLYFFGLTALIFAIAGGIIGIPVIVEFIQTDYIYKVPSAILASALFIISFLFTFLGLTLDYLASNERVKFEMKVNDFIYHEHHQS